MDLYEIRKELRQNNKSIFDLKLRVAYYARVSTDKDEQLHSLSAQEEYFEKLIKKNANWTLTRGYVDEGISATKVKGRESFLEMVEDAKAKRFDLLLTKEISRFARNTMDSLYYTQELLQNGIGVYFESDNINTLDPDAELRLTIMSSIAQDETRKISERVKFGFRESIKKGVVLGNDNIWGYQKENGKLIIVDEEAKMIRNIFDMYANQQIGIRKIAKIISQDGFRNSNGNPFSFSTIKNILINPKYKGFYCGNKTHKIDFRHNKIKYLSPDDWIMYEDPKNVPQIVSEELWDKANRILACRSEKMTSENKTSYQNKYTYSGKIICGEHKVPYHHTIYKYKSGNKELWQCKEYASGNVCKNSVIYNTEIDTVIREVYKQIICEKSDIINDLIEIYKDSFSTKFFSKTKHKTLSEINNLLAKKDKLLDLNLDNRITNEEFEQRNIIFNNQINELNIKLNKLEKDEQKNNDLKESIEKLRTSILNELDFTNELGKKIIDSFIEKIIIYKGNAEYEKNIKIFLKVIPTNYELEGKIHKNDKNQYILGSDTITQTRGGNSKSLKKYNIKFNYELLLSLT